VKTGVKIATENTRIVDFHLIRKIFTLYLQFWTERKANSKSEVAHCASCIWCLCLSDSMVSSATCHLPACSTAQQQAWAGSAYIIVLAR